MTDWADEKAREWLSQEADNPYTLPLGKGSEASLAALLREVRVMGLAAAFLLLSRRD